MTCLRQGGVFISSFLPSIGGQNSEQRHFYTQRDEQGKSQLIGKDLDARKDWGQEENWATEDKMVGCHHPLNGQSLSKLWEAVKDGEAWCTAVHGITKSRKRLIHGTTKRGRNPWGSPLCVIVIIKAMESKSKKQFQGGVRIGFSLQHLRNFRYPKQVDCSSLKFLTMMIWGWDG